jgi:hypothetical protein
MNVQRIGAVVDLTVSGTNGNAPSNAGHRAVAASVQIDSARQSMDPTNRRSAAHSGLAASAANGMQLVYVYDNQIGKIVVKMRDIETQRIAPDPLPTVASATTAVAVATVSDSKLRGVRS